MFADFDFPPTLDFFMRQFIIIDMIRNMTIFSTKTLINKV